MQGDWAVMQTSASGTGSTITVSAISGALAFADRYPTGFPFRYVIADPSTNPWKPIATGYGSINGTTFTRDSAETTYVSGIYTYLGSLASLPGTTLYVCAGAMAADLSATVPAIQNVAGQKLVLPDGLWPVSNGSNTLTANTPVAACLRWNNARPITSMACEVATVSGTGSDRIQLGIYACNSDGTPGVLLARTGDIAPNSTGYKTASLSSGTNLQLDSGWYWFVIASSVTPVVRAYDAGSDTRAFLGSPMGMLSGMVYRRIGHFLCSSIGSGWTALPSSITLATAREVNGYFTPIVGAVVT